MTGPSWTIEDVHLEDAAAAVLKHAIRTPLVPAPKLGPSVWMKLETEQYTGSFKLRGALAALSGLEPDAREAGVVTASAGNHGLGIAWAARVLGLHARVLVPARTSMIKRDGIAALGGHVTVTEHAGYDETEAEARSVAQARGATFVSAYDDPRVAAGNGGTIFAEIEGAKLDNLATVVAPVGGGGLMAGLGAQRDRSSPDTKLVGVQSEACPAMKRSLDEGKPIERMEGERTLAEGLEGGVTPTSFAHVRDAVSRIDLVTEDAIADAMRFAHETLGLTVEGSAATAIAWAREHAAEDDESGSIVVVVTGRNVSPDVHRRVLAGQPPFAD